MVNAYQTILLYFCMGMLGILVPILLVSFAYQPMAKMLGRLRKAGGLNMALAMLAVAALVAYGGTKPPLTVPVDFALTLGANVTEVSLNIGEYEYTANASTNFYAYAGQEITLNSISYAPGYTAGTITTTGLTGDNPYMVGTENCSIALTAVLESGTMTEYVNGYTWTYRIRGNRAEIYGTWDSDAGYVPAISPVPTGAVTIPSTLGGKPVACIGYHAFSGCIGLTNVTIPDSVRSIGYQAFSGCSGLTNVTFKGNAPSVGSSAFEGVDSSCIAHVSRTASGFPANGEEWNGMRICYTPWILYVDVENGYDGNDGLKYAPFRTIQHAVDEIEANGLVLVAPGEYHESVVISEKPVHILSLGGAESTSLYPDTGSYTTAFFIQQDAAGSSVEGFTVRNGTGPMLDSQRVGGGFCCMGSATIRDCIITENGERSWGGNTARGGGVYVGGEGTSVSLINCLVTRNKSMYGGGAAYVEYGCLLSLEQCTIYGNSQYYDYSSNVGGVMLEYGAALDCVNSIIWGNEGYQVGGATDGVDAVVNLSYSCLQDIYGNLSYVNVGDCVIMDDPCFNDPDNGDFSLQEWSPCRYAASYSNPDGTAGAIGYLYDGMTNGFNPEDFTYVANTDDHCREDGTATITHVSSNVTGKVVFPKVLDGYVVTGIGGLSDCIFEKPESITSVKFHDEIQSISLAAFTGCSSLSRIDIPASVSHIGNYYAGWSPEIVFKAYFNVDENNAWYSSDATGGLFDKEKKVLIRAPGSSSNEHYLWSYRLPDTVEIIEDYAFSNLKARYGLYVTFPAAVTNISIHAFVAASDVYVTIDENNPCYKAHGRSSICNRDMTVLFNHWYNGSDSRKYTIPASITNINHYAFNGCYGMQSVTLHDNIEYIGEYAFATCTDLHEFVIPQKVEELVSTFLGCGNLERVVMPEGCAAKYLYNFMFHGCSNLTEVVLSEGIEYIGNSVFWRCTSLPELTIPESVTHISGIEECYSLTNISFRGLPPGAGINTGCPDTVGYYRPKYAAEWQAVLDAEGKWHGIPMYERAMPNKVVFSIGEHGTWTGGGVLEQTVLDCEAAQMPVVTPEEGWMFVGWDVDFSSVESNMTVSAIIVERPRIENVTAKQRWPWNGKMDITYEVVGDIAAGLPEGSVPALLITATNRTDGTSYVAAANALSGDTGTEAGTHHVVWDLNAQGLEFVSDDVVFTVAYAKIPLYCVIDLSGGKDAASYPISYLADLPSGGWSDEYKTTKLVLRLVEPGTFMMYGSYQVTLTKPFYCGVFEVTQKQYELVTGSNPSYYQGDMRPVERVSWNTIRGDSSTYNWPNSSAVDSNSFVGRLQARTGLNFDLPTEAQWEYACRAGTTSKYNNGGDTENDLRELGRYYYNRSDGKGGYTDAHTKVGSYQPNAWGLYDMHGNVWEWCLDWDGRLSSGVTDPVGSSSGSDRVDRGGSWDYDADGCTSSDRYGYDPSSEFNGGFGGFIGFRLVRTLSNTEGERSPEAVAGAERAEKICSGESAVVVVDSRIGARESEGSETLAYSSLWDGDAGATVTIAQNGVAVAEGLTGEGEFEWNATAAGTWVLTHTTYTNGVAGAVETATFYLPAKDIAAAQVVVDCSDAVYSGSPIAPPVQSVVWGGRTLVEGTDYEVSYSANVDVGTATITLTGINLFDGTYTTNFNITAKALAAAMVGAVEDVVYTGAAFTPTPAVTDAERGVALVNGTDYTLSYANNVNAGTATVIVTGKGNYTGSISKQFTIAKATYDMSGAAWDYSGPFTYDGTAKSISVVGLPSGVTVSRYANRTKTAAGSYTATATLSYDSSNYHAPSVPSCAWAIARRNISDATITLGGSLTYNGGAQVQSVSSVKTGGLTATYTVSGNTATDAGTYTLAVTGTGNFTGTATKPWTIARKDIVGAEVTLGDSPVYTGAELTQTVTGVTVDGLKATYTVSGDKATDAGTYTLTVTGTGNFTGTVTKLWRIRSAEMVLDVASYDGVYDGEGHGITVTVTEPQNAVVRYAVDGQRAGSALYHEGDGSALYYAEDTILFTNVLEEAVTVWYTVEAANYVTVTNYGMVMISPKTLTDEMVADIGEQTYSSLVIEPEVTVADEEPCVITADDYDIAYADNIDAGTASVTVTGKGNYTGTVTKTFAINPKNIAGATVALGAALTYNGGVQVQAVTGVTADGLDVTYTMSGNTATEPGTYTLTVTGTGNFTGTATKQYMIAKRSISGATVTLGDALTYTGAEQRQGVLSVTVDGLDVTFAVSGDSATDAGTYTLTVTGTGNFTGTAAKQYTIAPKPLTAAMVGAAEDAVYTGAAFTPSPAVTDAERGVALVNGTDYTLAYANNVNAGTATVTVNGRGNYSGTVTRNFTVAKQVVPLPEIASREYTGNAQLAVVPTSALYDIVQPAVGIDAGQYDVKLRLVDSANYTWPGIAGSDVILKFTITPKDISGADLALSGTFVYTGAEQTQPVPDITVDGLKATYTVSGDKATDAGIYTLTVTGAGNFVGTISRSWRILPAEMVLDAASYDGVYDGEGHGIAVTVTEPQNAVVRYAYVAEGPYAEDAILFTNALEEAVTVWYTVEAANYSSVTNCGTVMISPKALTDEMVGDIGEQTYSSLAIEPEVAVADEEPCVITADDYDVAYADNIDAGMASVTVTGKGNYTGTVTKTFAINPKDIAGATVALGAELTYNGEVQEQSVTGVTVDGLDVTYTVSGNTATGAGTYTLTVTGTGNFSGTVTKEFAIAKATYDMSGAAWDYSVPFTYDGTAKSVSVVGLPSGVTVSSYANNSCTDVGDYTATATLGYDSANYEEPSVPSCAWSIAPRDVSDATITLGDSLTYNGMEQVQSVSGVSIGGLPVTCTVSGNTATEAGTYTLTVTGTGNFTGTATAPWTIARKDIAGAEVTLGDSPVYTGAELTQAVTGVTVDGLTVTYTVGGNTATDAGTYTLTVTGTGNFTGTATKPWRIRPAEMVLDVASYDGVYDGEGHGMTVTVTKPSVGATVKYAYAAEGPYLEEPILFTNALEEAATVWYRVEAANYVTVTNCGTVMISPKTLTDEMVDDIPAQIHLGLELEPDVTVADAEPCVVTEDDYDVAYSGNVNAGTATVTVTGKGNYTGEVVKTFAIVAWHVEGTDFAYDGEAHGFEIVPEGEVDAWSVVYALTQEGPYGDERPTLTEAGSLVVWYAVRGLKDAATTNSATIKVTKSVSHETVSKELECAAYVYDGTAKRPAVHLRDTTAAADVNVAAYSAGDVDGNGVLSENDVTLIRRYIAYLGLSDAMKEKFSSYNLTGSALAAADANGDGVVDEGDVAYVNARFECYDMKEGVDYTVAYADNVNAGTATATVTGMGRYSGTVTFEFTIAKADMGADGEPGEGPVPPGGVSKYDATFVYDGQGHTVDVEGIAAIRVGGIAPAVAYSLDGEAWQPEAFVFTNACVTSVWYRLAAANYNDYVHEARLMIEPKAITAEAMSVKLLETSCRYDGAAHEPAVEVVDYGIFSPQAVEPFAPGDVDGDGLLTYDDIDLIDLHLAYLELDEGTRPFFEEFELKGAALAAADYNGDGVVDSADKDALEGSFYSQAEGETLVEGVDYTVSYRDNVGIGTATAAVTGIGNYTNTVELTFEIARGAKRIEGTATGDLAAAAFTFDGTEKTVVYVSDGVLPNETVEVTLTGTTNAIHAGTYTAVANGVIRGFSADEFYDYEYETTLADVEFTWTIAPRSGEGLDVTLETDVCFGTGAPVEPGVTVADAGLGTTLAAGTDYELQYEDNTEAGEATVRVCFTNDYAGAVERTFRILPDIETLPTVAISPVSGELSGITDVTFAYPGIVGLDTCVRYTLDGTDPTAESATGDAVQIDVAALVTVKAAAFCGGLRVSVVSEVTYSPSLADVIDIASFAVKGGSLPMTFSLGGDMPWWEDEGETSLDGTSSMKSGKAGANGVSWMKASVEGAGLLEFSWKASCERDETGAYGYDHVECLVDGVAVACLDGVTEWAQVLVPIETDGAHEVEWRYVKDGEDGASASVEDCAWVDGIKFSAPVLVAFAASGAEGDVPETVFSAEGYSVTLPGPGGLTLAKHTFSGWSDGETTRQPGDEYVVGSADVTFAAVWTAKVATAPVIAAPAEYDTIAAEVTISGADGAAIYYTTDGSDPSAGNGTLYAGAFEVQGTTTIKAVAVMEDCFDSEVASAVAVRTWGTYNDCLDSQTLTFRTGGDALWLGVLDEFWFGGSAVRSGPIGDSASTWIETTVEGEGTITFWWKTSSEKYKSTPIDFVSFSIDGLEATRFGGETSWTNRSFTVNGDGMHILRWEYSKDEMDIQGLDCAWLDAVTWTPAPKPDESLLPELASDSSADVVELVLERADFADADGIMTLIGGDVEKYGKFREWALSVKDRIGAAAGEAAVIANTNSVVAYLLGAERLFENSPTIVFGDVEVRRQTGGSTSGIGAANHCQLALSVVVKDGEDAVVCAAEKVKEMFEATGDLGDWNGKAKLTPTVTVEGTVGAVMRFKVVPGDGTATRAFLRIKVK